MWGSASDSDESLTQPTQPACATDQRRSLHARHSVIRQTQCARDGRIRLKQDDHEPVGSSPAGLSQCTSGFRAGPGSSACQPQRAVVECWRLIHGDASVNWQAMRISQRLLYSRHVKVFEQAGLTIGGRYDDIWKSCHPRSWYSHGNSRVRMARPPQVSIVTGYFTALENRPSSCRADDALNLVKSASPPQIPDLHSSDCRGPSPAGGNGKAETRTAEQR